MDETLLGIQGSIILAETLLHIQFSIIHAETLLAVVKAYYSYSYIICTEFQLVRNSMFLYEYSIVKHAVSPR
jgi:hypothetical protein